MRLVALPCTFERDLVVFLLVFFWIVPTFPTWAETIEISRTRDADNGNYRGPVVGEDTGYRRAGSFEIREILLTRPDESPIDGAVLTAVRFDPSVMAVRSFVFPMKSPNSARGSATTVPVNGDGPSCAYGITAAGLLGSENMAGFTEKLVFNAGFFDTSGKPLGLLMDRGRILSRLKRKGRLAEGIFEVRDDRARICGPDSIDSTPADKGSANGSFAVSIDGNCVATAVQAGPILVPIPDRRRGDKGAPWLESRKRESRCAVGIDGSGRVVVIVVSGITGGITLAEFSELLVRSEKSGGLGLVSALNLDGGTSAQLSLETGETRIDRGGLRRIPACLAVVPRAPR